MLSAALLPASAGASSVGPNPASHYKPVKNEAQFVELSEPMFGEVKVQLRNEL